MKKTSVILWLAFWPFSEVVGRPPEVDEDIGWLRGLKLLGVCILICLIASLFANYYT